MDPKNYKIHIIGAGVSGLVAAKVLEQHGFYPTLLEATDGVGGRVRTDLVDGHQLDRGFQVLLTAYPAAKKFLDLEALDLQLFKPGAVIFNQGKQDKIGDPLRDSSFWWATIISGAGSLSDKWKVLQLNRKLKRTSIEELFQANEQSTLDYLRAFGFSNRMIDRFFKPFFSGIFLEPDLRTSSRLFTFIYKMFGKGYAALPKSGIGAIPKQLLDSLSHTELRLQTRVSEVQSGKIGLHSGELLESDYTIVATNTQDLIQGMDQSTQQWKSCDTLYFETAQRNIKDALIGLISDQGSLINNIFFHSSLPMEHSSEKEILSVTVAKDHQLSETALIDQVQDELNRLCGIRVSKFLKRYEIPMALPDLASVSYEAGAGASRHQKGIYIAGDHTLQGSLNAAMLAGERAALDIIYEIRNA